MPEISATIRVVDAFSNPLDKLSNGLSRAQSGFSKLKGALGGNMFGGAEKSSSGLFKSMAGGVAVGNMISKGMGLAGAGIRSLIADMNESNATWKTFDGNMHQLGASSNEINSAKADMQKFAQQTIYSASDMSSTYSQLAAVGIKNTGQLVKGFGGLAAAADNPQQAMKTLSEQATQMAAKPMVQWQDFKFMLDQTPGGIAAVAKTMNMNTRQLVKSVQDGKVKTDEFLGAIAKTGTNANFSKMATQYKTVGQAMDGLKETLSNSLGPSFDAVSKVGINAISGIADKIGSINGKALGEKVTSWIENAQNKIDAFKEKMSNGFAASFNVAGFRNMITAIGNAINNVKNAFSGVGGSLANSLGSLSGKGLNGISSVITSIANAISKMSPGQIRATATAITTLVGSLAALKAMSSVAGTISNIATSIGMIKGGFGSAAKGIQAIPTAFSKLGKTKNDVQGLFSILKDGASSANAVNLPKMLGGGTQLGASLGGMLGKINGIKTALSGLSPAISGAFSPIGGIVIGATAIIAGAVSAWKSNFMGFRDTVSQAFSGFGQVIGSALSGLGQAFAPIRETFGQIGQALSPAINAVKQFVTALGAIVGTGVLLGLAMIVDIFKNIVTGISAAFSALKGFIQGLHGVGDAISDIAHGDFSFSHARKTFADAGKAFADAKKNFHPFDFSTTGKTFSNAIKNAKKSFGNQKVKVKTDVDTSGISKKMSSATKGGNHKIKIGAKADLSSVNKQISSISKKQISAPKVKAPKVPQPKMPKVKTMPAPKIKTPRIPQPKMPKLRTIPAPKVQRPNMSGVVSAVRSGMSRAAAAARAGGAQISAAVRSALNQAIAAARSAAGAMQAAGAMIGAGLAAGIRSQIGAVAAAANELVAQANRAARAAAQIHSPSRLFAEVGSFIGQGMAVGMDSTRGLISQSSRAMINSAYPGLNSSINSSGSLSSSSIRPNSATSSNYYTGGTNNSSEITIAPGAIVINSSGSPEEDADALLDRLEEKIMEQANKSLS